MREHKKKWLFDKGKTSGEKKRWVGGRDFANDRNTKEFQDLEYIPKRNGMKPRTNRGGIKSQLDFSPLRRFLKSKVGKSWDLVYSEICDRIPEEIRKTHNPVDWYVCTHTKLMEDGSIVDTAVSSWGNRNVISKDGINATHARYSTYYVHPETRELCRLIPRIRKSKEGPNPLTKKEGKKIFAKENKNRKKSTADYKAREKERSDLAAEKMKEKKRLKNDIQEG